MSDHRRDPEGERLREERDALRAENAALRRREAFSRAINEVNVDAVFVKDVLGRYLMINGAGARRLGRHPEEVVGSDDRDLFDPETAARIMAADREIIAEGASRAFEEVATSGGLTRSYLVTKSPYRDERGRAIGVIEISRDITRRRQAEEALREAREFLERLLEHAPTPVYVAGGDGRARLVNRAWEEMFGMGRGEVIGRPVEEIFPPGLSGRMLAQDREVFEAAASRAFEEEYDTRRGRVWLYTVKFPLRDAAGRIEAVGGISVDVTQLRHLEGSLEESRRRLQALFDNALDSIWLLDDSGRFVDANPAVCALLGYTREEFLRMAVRDVVTERDRAAVMDLWREILGAGTMAGEYTQLARDGTTREVDYRAVAHILPGLHLSVNRDITERKRAEREWRDQNAALENAVEGVSRIDAGGHYRSANPAYAAMLGYRSEELIGRGWLSTVHPDDRERAVAAYRTMQERGRSEMEVRGLRRDGSSFWKQNVKVRAEEGHYCFTKDITERKEAEAERERLLEHLQTLSRRLIEAREAERRHLARELHDEVGQLLGVVGVNLHALKGVCGDAARHRLDECLGVVDRATQQVRNLALDLRPSMLDDLGLAAALRWLVDRQSQRAGLAGNFAVRTSGAPLPSELATAGFRVAQEALTNVVRHARARHVWMELMQGEDEVELVIRDDGVGFDPGEARRRAARGESLGLLGIQERVELLGGRTAIESAPGRGTAIRIRIPLTPVPPRDDLDRGGGRR